MMTRRFLPARSRGGATLTEVLMSLLIMSIGIVSVITIFPVSILRSIQATQLTNAKTLRQNAEEFLRGTLQEGRVPLTAAGAYPVPYSYRMIDQSTFPGLGLTAAPAINTGGLYQTFRGEWQPFTLYQLGQIVQPVAREGELRPATNRWFICTNTTDPSGLTGTSGAVEPNWELGPPPPPLLTTQTDTMTDGQLSWTCVTARLTTAAGTTYLHPIVLAPFDPNVVYDALNYVVDPLGWSILAREGTDILLTADLVNDFGYKVDRVSGLGSRSYFNSANAIETRPLLRINGGAFLEADAAGLASLPDSWSVEQSSICAVGPATGATSAVFPTTVDLSTITPLDRIVFTSLSDSRALTRPVLTSTPASRTITWLEPLPPQGTAIPGFIPDGPARLEHYNLYYTWLATVNKDLKGNARVTVAVFAKRGFRPAEEHIYDANYANGLAVDQIRISWNTATEPDPLLRAGNYVLDGFHAVWYRIVAIQRNGVGAATLTVDRPIPLAQQTVDPATLPGRVILMRGIVALFEL